MSKLETTIIKHPSSTANNLLLNPDGTVDFYSPQSGGAAPGAVMYYAMQTPPAGWLVCDGSSHPIATYPTLHAAIGNTFGGDATTFKLPDLRGEFIRGWDDGRGVDAGRTFGSFQDDAFESHTHTDSGHVHDLNSQHPNGVVGWNSGGNSGWAAGTYGSPTRFCKDSEPASANISNTGGVETRPKNIALLPCIKT